MSADETGTAALVLWLVLLPGGLLVVALVVAVAVRRCRRRDTTADANRWAP